MVNKGLSLRAIASFALLLLWTVSAHALAPSPFLSNRSGWSGLEAGPLPLSFRHESRIPLYADENTATIIERMFQYIFDASYQYGSLARVTMNRLNGLPVELFGARFVPLQVLHGEMPITAFRFGTAAYITDCSTIPDASWPLLDGVRTLVLDALRERAHTTHFSVPEAVKAAARIGADRTYFTHISHELGHAETCARLPRGVELAYDGLVLEIDE